MSIIPDIVLNPNTGSVSDDSRSAKDIKFKSNVCVKGDSHQKAVPVVPNELSKPGERVFECAT